MNMPVSIRPGVILGVGHDICSIERIEGVIDKFGPQLLSRICTEAEQEEAHKRSVLAPYVAGRFAAKEAVYKALSSTDQSGMSWRQAEILTGVRGKPVLRLHGRCQDGLMSLLPEGAMPHLHISLSHEREIASAFVILSSEYT